MSSEVKDNADVRYSGHLNLCEIDRPGQERLRKAWVLIVGAGGLGSPVALYLAAAGAGRITVLDPDTVSLSNLQRQIIHTTADLGRPKAVSAREKMLAINPDITVVPLEMPLTPSNAAELIGDHDVVMDCTDNLATRLLISDTCVALGKPYVFGAVRRFGGQVFTHTAGSAAYRDIFDATEPEEGDEPCSLTGVLNTVVGVVGSLQATEAVKLLAGTGDLLANRLLVFDAITMTFSRFEIQP